MQYGYAIKVLKVIDKWKAITTIKLLNAVGGSATTVTLGVKELKKRGLVTVEENNAFPFQKVIMLTSKGIAVLEANNR